MIELRGKRKNKKTKPVDLFLSFSITQVVNDQVATTDNIKTQLRPCVSARISLWCPTSRIKQPRKPRFQAWQRVCIS